MNKKLIKAKVISRFRYVNKPITPEKLNELINITIKILIKIINLFMLKRTPEIGKSCL